MKKLILIALLIFSSPSYAEWTKVLEDEGDAFYVDFDRIRKHDGYVYFWVLTDYLKPTDQGHLSNEMYYQGDCKLFRSKILQFVFYTGNMGGGPPDVQEPLKKHQIWRYPSPYTPRELVLKYVCSW